VLPGSLAEALHVLVSYDFLAPELVPGRRQPRLCAPSAEESVAWLLILADCARCVELALRASCAAGALDRGCMAIVLAGLS